MFAKGMTVDFLLILFLTVAVLFALWRSRNNPRTIRRIPGLDAIEEGVGRATEMNKPVLYLPGFGDLSDPQTLASMAVLSEVSKATARYDARLIVADQISYLQPMFEAVVKSGYASQGKLDSFKPEEIRWFSDHYFGYAIAVIGLMFRERVATTVMIGNFAFDALMYAEAGSQAGAIQIGGTANTTQIPFFVAACDYALIGEEIYAAAAYLTKDPVRVATIVAEDWGKWVVAGLVILGAILNTAGAVAGLNKFLNS